MKKLAYLLVLLLIACQPRPKSTDKLVTVSILPQKYFVDQISGGLLQVNVLVPPGASPHEYSVLPSQMKALSKSKVWLQIGLLNFEDVWKESFANINKNLVLVNCSEGIVPILGSDEEDRGHDPSHAFDPHIWLAPAESKIIAKNTLAALKKAFPEDAAAFDTNYARFIAEIDSLSAKIEQQLSALPNRSFLIFHPGLGYFARQYHLQQIPLELNGKEPSPKHMKDIVDIARAKNIHTVFIQKEFDAENALQLSREINGNVIVIDPLAYNWKKQILDISQKIAAEK